MTQNTVLILLSLIALTTFTAVYNVPSVKAAAADIRILSHRGFYSPPPVGSYGTYNVVGEIENVGDAAATNVSITVSFYIDSVIIVSKNASILIDNVLPNAKVPFKAGYAGTADVHAEWINRYTVSLNSWSTAQSKPLMLQVLNSTYYVDGTLTQTLGTLKNIETTPNANATNTQVTVIFHYKSNNSIFWASRSLANPTVIVPSEKSTFKISSYPASIPHDIVNVTVVAESKEYLSNMFLNPMRDTIKPTIGTPAFLNSPTPQQIIPLNVTVTKPDYASKVKQVLLYYKAQGEQTFKMINMTLVEGVWRPPLTSPFGPFGAGQTISFYIEAMDEAGNKQSTLSQGLLYQFTVQGEVSGVPLEVLIVAFIAVVLIVVIYKYRKKLF